MSEPTFQDLVIAAKFIIDHESDSVGDAAHALAWLIAGYRDRERETCVKLAAGVDAAERNAELVRDEIVDRIRALAPR